MIERYKDIARGLVVVLWLATLGAAARAEQPSLTEHSKSTSVTPSAAAPNAAPQGPAIQPTAPAAPRVDTVEINRRVSQEVGYDIHATIDGWKRGLDRLEGEFRRPNLRYVELNSFRDELQGVHSEVTALWNALRPRLAAAKAEVDLLEPAPAAGQPPESQQVALRRAELKYHLGLLSEGQSAVNAANLRIDQLTNAVQDIRRKNFTTKLFQRVPGLYSYQTWADTPEYAPLVAGRVADLMVDWWKNVRDHDEVVHIAIAATLLWFALSLVGWWGRRRLRAWPGEGEPPFWSRASSAAGIVTLRILSVASPIVFLYVTLAATQGLPEAVDWLFYVAAQSLIVVLTVNALATTVFAPGSVRWRLIPASDHAAARLCGLIILLAVVYGLSSLAYVATVQVQAPFALTMVIAFSSSLLTCAIVVAILLTPLGGERQDGLPRLRWPKALRAPIWAAMAAIVVSALVGYLSLSRFLARQLIVTGSILALLYLLLLWVEGFAQSLSDDGSAAGRWLTARAGLERRRREQLAVPFSLLLKFLVLALSVPLIMVQWGYAWPDIYDWYRQLFFGFHIANTEVSLAVLFASIIVFGVAYAAARLFQGWLDSRILKPAGVSGGVRDSIRIAVGYVGVAIAALAAFSFAGLNLSSLAIVAGALSVGIGFGLQSIVNNFVSGLILLAERPIKIGDLVVVAGEEGYVRKISIRSTEVETSDRAHVVVPNSYFITEKVKNWTHRNSLRRMAIPVTVDCSANPREVKAILLKVAEDNPNVVAAPAPSVALEDFGDSLNFKLYVFYDVDKDVGTDLRIAILDALHEAGVRKMAYLAKREPSESCRFDDRGKVDGAAPRLLRGQGSGAYLGSRAT
jgi:small-conductance mechanosensitive channel